MRPSTGQSPRLRKASHPLGYIKLHPNDQKKYGAPPEIPFDLAAIGIRQRAAFVRETKRSLSWLFNQLAGVPELDDAGNPIPIPVLDDDGKPVLNADGTEKVTEKLKVDDEALAMLVWLALWGVGIKRPWDTFDPQFHGLEILDGEDEADEPGKGEAPETDSANSTSSPD